MEDMRCRQIGGVRAEDGHAFPTTGQRLFQRRKHTDTEVARALQPARARDFGPGIGFNISVQFNGAAGRRAGRDIENERLMQAQRDRSPEVLRQAGLDQTGEGRPGEKNDQVPQPAIVE